MLRFFFLSLKEDLYVKFYMDFRFFPSIVATQLSLWRTYIRTHPSIFLKSFNSICIFACCARSMLHLSFLNIPLLFEFKITMATINAMNGGGKSDTCCSNQNLIITIHITHRERKRERDTEKLQIYY